MKDDICLQPTLRSVFYKPNCVKIYVQYELKQFFLCPYQ